MSKDASTRNSGHRNLVVRIDDKTREALTAAAAESGQQPVASVVRRILATWVKSRAAARDHAAA